MTAEARFWAKVDKAGTTQPHMSTPCWIWTGQLNDKGYGTVRFGRKMQKAHRVAWLLATGADAGTAHVLHQCDNRACVRFDHLSLGDHVQNMTEMRERGRAFRPKGSRNPHSVLTEDTVRELRRLVASGETVRGLCRRFGLGRTMVRSAVNGVTWKHVSFATGSED